MPGIMFRKGTVVCFTGTDLS